jgi:hypothetical protein
MPVQQIQQDDDFRRQIQKHPEAHFVCPAWIADEAPLTHLAQFFMNLPLKNSQNVSRVKSVNPLSNELQYDWESLSRDCDVVNDGHDTGTSMPNFRLTLLPAFTGTSGLRSDRCRQAISDVFKAHRRYLSSEDEIVFLVPWGRGLGSRFSQWLLSEVDKQSTGLKVTVVFGGEGFDVQ